jgi:hypothetical protein
MRPDNLFDFTFEKIAAQGFKRQKVETKNLRDGDLLQMSKDGELWCKIDNAKYLRSQIKGVESLEIWRLDLK